MFRIRINFILPVYYSGSTNNISLYSFEHENSRPMLKCENNILYAIAWVRETPKSINNTLV